MSAPVAGSAAEAGTARGGSVAARFGQGASDIVPFMIGVLPLGLAIGATLAASSVPALAGWLAGPLIYGGSAQLLTIEMLDAGAVPWVIVLSAVLVNARVLMYGAALAPWFTGARLRTRLLLAAPIIDPLFFLVQPRFQRGDLTLRGRIAYYAGAASSLLVGWMTVQWVGIAVGSALPDALSLDMAAALAFIGVLASMARTRPAAATAGVAGLAAVVGSGLPFQSGLSVGIAAGIAAGLLVSRTLRPRPADPVAPTSPEELS